jgi:hypothetical protein
MKSTNKSLKAMPICRQTSLCLGADTCEGPKFTIQRTTKVIINMKIILHSTARTGNNE